MPKRAPEPAPRAGPIPLPKKDAQPTASAPLKKHRADGDRPCCSLFQPLRYDACVAPTGEGLLACQSVWFLSDVDIGVHGKLLSGVPISMHANTVRVINDSYSYYIPLHKIDYIRTPDGLLSSFEDGDA